MKSLGMKVTIKMILKIRFCVSKCVSNERELNKLILQVVGF